MLTDMIMEWWDLYTYNLTTEFSDSIPTSMGLTMPCPDLPRPLPAFQPIFCSSLFPMLSPPIPDLVGCSYLQNDQQLGLSQQYIVLNNLKFHKCQMRWNFLRHTSIKKCFCTLTLHYIQIISITTYGTGRSGRLCRGSGGGGIPYLSRLSLALSRYWVKKKYTYNVLITFFCCIIIQWFKLVSFSGYSAYLKLSRVIPTCCRLHLHKIF